MKYFLETANFFDYTCIAIVGISGILVFGVVIGALIIDLLSNNEIPGSS